MRANVPASGPLTVSLAATAKRANDVIDASQTPSDRVEALTGRPFAACPVASRPATGRLDESTMSDTSSGARMRDWIAAARGSRR